MAPDRGTRPRRPGRTPVARRSAARPTRCGTRRRRTAVGRPRRWTGSWRAYASVGELSEDGDAIVGGDAGRGRRDRRRGDRRPRARSSRRASPCSPACRAPTTRRSSVLVHGPAGRSPAASSGRPWPSRSTAHQRERRGPGRRAGGAGRGSSAAGSAAGSWPPPACRTSSWPTPRRASLIAAGEVDAILVPGRPGRRERRRRGGDRHLPARRRRRAPSACRSSPASPPASIDPATADGAAIGIGYLRRRGRLERVGNDGARAGRDETRVPTHDITPAELITTWLTAEGRGRRRSDRRLAMHAAATGRAARRRGSTGRPARRPPPDGQRRDPRSPDPRRAHAPDDHATARSSARFLETDRLFAAYALCDLEDREFARTRWGAAFDGERARRDRRSSTRA